MVFVTNSRFSKRYRSLGQYLFTSLIRLPIVESRNVARKVSSHSGEPREASGESRKASVEVHNAITELRNTTCEMRNTGCEGRNGGGGVLNPRWQERKTLVERCRRFGEVFNAFVGQLNIYRDELEKGKL